MWINSTTKKKITFHGPLKTVSWQRPLGVIWPCLIESNAVHSCTSICITYETVTGFRMHINANLWISSAKYSTIWVDYRFPSSGFNGMSNWIDVLVVKGCFTNEEWKWKKKHQHIHWWPYYNEIDLKTLSNMFKSEGTNSKICLCRSRLLLNVDLARLREGHVNTNRKVHSWNEHNAEWCTKHCQ